MAADPAVAPRPHAPRRTRLRPAPPPRRVSGPARRRRNAPPAPAAPLARVLEGIRTVGDSRLLDRLIRGQGWVVLLAALLMGIVALQVMLLKLNTGIGQSIERAGALERPNAALRAEVSALSSEERIQRVALEEGMLMPAAGEVRYVAARGEEDASKAASVMRPPDPPETITTPVAPTATATTAPTADPAATTTAPPAEEQTAPPAEATTAPPADGTQTTQPPADSAGAVAAPAATPTGQ